MASTAERGYGYRHQRLRAILLAALVPGSPCPRCGQPMWPHAQQLDLGHVDGSGKTAYQGLEHARCNRQAGSRLYHEQAGHKPRRRRRRRSARYIERTDEPPRTSRRW